MQRIFFTAAVAFAFSMALPALAGGHDPKAEAQAMSSALKGGGGGNNSPLKSALGLSGNGGVASFVSGNKSVLGTEKTGGWGNVGSTLTGKEGVSVSGR